VHSDLRTAGTVSNDFFRILPYPLRSICSISVCSFSTPNTIYNIQSASSLIVSFEGVGPITVTLPAGNYSYGTGTLSYSSTGTYPAGTETDLRTFFLGSSSTGFQGNLQSIYVNPVTGIWTWNFAVEASLSTTSTSSLLTILGLTSTSSYLSNATWISGTPVDLSGPLQIALSSSRLDSEQLTSVAGLNLWFCLVNRDVAASSSSGDVIYHVPIREDRSELLIGQSAQNLDSFNVSLLDPLTQLPLNGLVRWSLVLRLYTESTQS